MNTLLKNQKQKTLTFTEYSFIFPNPEKYQEEFILRVYPDNSNTFHYGDGVEINTHQIDNLDYAEDLIKYHIAMMEYLNLEIPDWMLI